MQVNEEQNIGDEAGDRETEQGFTPWTVVRARTMLHVRAGERYICAVSLRPSIKGPERPMIETRAWSDARLIAAAPALYEIVHAIGDRCTNMYAGQRCPLGFKDSKMWCLPCRAVAVLALVNKPDTNSANSDHPAHGQASKTEVQK